jgi:class 3 adenylate cyclase
MRHLFDRLRIRSKLLIMLLGVGLISANLIGWISDRNGRRAIEERVVFQLRSIREARAHRIEDYFAELKRQAQTLSEDATVAKALRELTVAYHELNQTELSTDEREKLTGYYRDTFVPRLKETTGSDPLAEAYVPTSAAGRYLQYHYMVAVPEEKRPDTIDPRDGSHYSAVHAKFHPYLRRISDRYDYDDIMLLDPRSNEFVYAVWKEADLGGNIQTGPSNTSALAQVVREVMHRKDRGSVVFSDFELYRMTYGIPSAFIATPVYDGPEYVGILVIQLPIDELNKLMTSDGKWQYEGLGKTGETYIVGPDRLMRSMSRTLMQDKQAYLRSLREVGYPETTLRRIDKFDTSILQQQIFMPFVSKALVGQQGVTRTKDYRGVEVLAAYRPLRMDGLNWALVAQSDVSEAFITADKFHQVLSMYVIGLMVGVSFLSLLLARAFTRPIGHILGTIAKVQTGDLEAKITVESKDEFGRLGVHFNDMLQTLRSQREEIEQKSQENEALLLNVLPAPVARRVKEGRSALAENFPSVTVLVAHVDNLSRATVGRPAHDSADLLNRVVTLFDAAAEEYSVERIRIQGSTYLAVCGLNIPQLDHARQMIEFAKALVDRVQLMGLETGIPLALRTAIHTGPVIAGIVGSRRFIYDVWGETVNIANRAHSRVQPNVIAVTQNVYKAVHDQFEFQASPASFELEQGVAIDLWELRHELPARLEPSLIPGAKSGAPR